MKRNLLLLRTLAVFLSLVLGLPHSAQALRQSGLEENRAKKSFLQEIGYTAPAAGMEEKQAGQFIQVLDESMPRGLGVLVIEAGEISRRTGLEEFVARVPKSLAREIVLFGPGSSVIKKLAVRNGIAVVDSDRLDDLAVRLAGMEEAARIGYVGDPARAGLLSKILPASMAVTPFDPGTALDRLLGYLGYPQTVLDALNAAGAEELFARARAA